MGINSSEPENTSYVQQPGDQVYREYNFNPFSLRSKMTQRVSVLIEPSHDVNNQTVSSTDVFMAEWSEHKTKDLRGAC